MSQSFELVQTEQGLALVWQQAQPAMQPLLVDFHEGKVAYRAQHSSLKSEAITKAVGVSGKFHPAVIDATAGLARDALVLARFGCPVALIERHPMVRELLADALSRAQQKDDVIGEAARQMQLLKQTHVAQLPDNSTDVVYLDPMFPKTGKQKALVKKDMQMFQQLVGSDDDADQLLAPAQRVARFRVVVKRPNSAPFLAGSKPSTQLKSKKHRFDIYIKQGFPN
ncbi:class I SAM-dependent methyltransferase [Idiomarina seosinensis]|uniref:class I SAM-dependent methyltransferase n=1 Tax=Idiomarina seosinensis TaxID=281739 RepID=UPI00384E68A0